VNKTQITELVQKVKSLTYAGDTTALANLRKAGNKNMRVFVIPYIKNPDSFRGNERQDETELVILSTVGAVAAMMIPKGLDNNSRNLGCTFRSLYPTIKPTERTEFIHPSFSALLSCRNIKQVCESVVRVSVYALNKGIKIDVEQLGKDLVEWMTDKETVKFNWVKGYLYGVNQKESQVE